MILAMDIGNTNIKTGVFDASTLRSYWRISTQRQYTSDEFGSLLLNLFAHEKLDPETIEGIIISSVVPTINFTVEHMCRSYFDLQPMFIAPGVKTGINIRYENPRELGSDRIANAVSAFTQYGGPVITIDFGTATTFGVVDENEAFLGGAIFPGIKLASQALSSGTAKLPSFEIAQPDRVIGRTTLSNLQSGMFYGYVAYRGADEARAGQGRHGGGHRRHGPDDRRRVPRDRPRGRPADPEGPALHLGAEPGGLRPDLLPHRAVRWGFFVDKLLRLCYDLVVELGFARRYPARGGLPG